MTSRVGFEQYGVIELNAGEMVNVNGGETVALPKWLKALSPAGVALYIIENWPDVKKGLQEGWNADKY